MSKKRKANSRRPQVRPLPSPPGFSGEEFILGPGQMLPFPRVCPMCPRGCAHEFTLAHALHDDGSLSPVQRQDALALLGIGVPGDAYLFACCACDWIEALDTDPGAVIFDAGTGRRGHA